MGTYGGRAPPPNIPVLLGSGSCPLSPPGLVTSLTYATRHGNMELPHDLALRVLYGCSSTILLMWALVVPLVFRFRLTRRVAVLAVAVYGVYQIVYISAVVHDARM